MPLSLGFQNLRPRLPVMLSGKQLVNWCVRILGPEMLVVLRFSVLFILHSNGPSVSWQSSPLAQLRGIEGTLFSLPCHRT